MKNTNTRHHATQFTADALSVRTVVNSCTIHSCTDLTSICVKGSAAAVQGCLCCCVGVRLPTVPLGRFAAGWRLKGGGGSCPARCRLAGGCGGWARNGASAVLRALSQRSDPAHDVQPGRRMALSLGRHGVSAVPQRWYRVGRSEEAHARRATRDRHWD